MTGLKWDQKTVKRIHQEDFCQALRIYPENKYASSGGPTLIDCFALIQENSIQPSSDTLKFFDAVVFNLIVGNADAHGKNISMLYGSNGVYLAPLYDLLSTVYYPKFTPNLAMNIEKCTTLENLEVKHWERFSKNVELGMPYIKNRIIEVANLVVAGIRKCFV